RGAVLPRRRLLQPRPHRSRNDDLPPLGLHPRTASEGAEEHAEPAEAGHRRVRGDDRRARPAGCRRGGGDRGESRLRRELEGPLSDPVQDDLAAAAEEEMQRACSLGWRQMKAHTPWGDTFEGFSPQGRSVCFERNYLWDGPEGGDIRVE